MIVAYIDGGARGNPGPAGFGVHLVDEVGNVLADLHDGLGIATNNVAEYQGLLAALRYALEHGHHALRIRSDSELLVKQMRGEYKVKNAGLQTLHAEARRLAARLERVVFEHIPRTENAIADRLANLAMDAQSQGTTGQPGA
jgi:probable phosphoglycerate mutase